MINLRIKESDAKSQRIKVRRKGEFSDNIKFSNACTKVNMKNEYNKNYTDKCKMVISREAWLADSRALAEQIRKNHGYQMIDVDRIIELDKQDQEDRFSLWIEE